MIPVPYDTGWASLLTGLEAVLASPHLALLIPLILAGVVLGMAVGVLPGFGPPAATAMLFPLVYTLPPLPGFALLAGLFYGAKYGGAVTSILLGIPGEPDAVATLLEGRPLAQAGQARKALRVSMASSFLGSMAALLGIALLAPFLSGLALRLSPAGRALLMLSALGLLCFLGQGDFRKNLAMALLGLTLAMVGFDPVYGASRLSFGSWRLASGLDLSALLMGMFGLGDILDTLLGRQHDDARSAVLADTRSHSPPLSLAARGGDPARRDQGPPPLKLAAAFKAALRGTAIGFGVGLIPSGAGVTASFTAYSLEKKLSPCPQCFGKGQWTGLAAPEAANNAAALSSFAPLLLLGLPTNPVMAAMLGAMTVGGLAPGPNLPAAQPEFFWGFLFSLAVGNVFLLILGLALARAWAGLARIPFRVLWPIILLLCLIGSWLGAGGMEGPVQCLLSGVFAVCMKRHGFSPVPLVLALVLGPSLESALAQSLIAF